jgi:pyruvate/2-oxoglutarate dehydrogenase complex dihydrolipoamide acyltransferase (E2) component
MGNLHKRNGVFYADYIDRNGGQKAPEAPAAEAATGPEAEAPPTPAPARVGAAAPVAAGKDDEVIPFSNMRRRTAEHMVRSKATSAHVLVATEVDYAGVEKVRKAAREQFKAKEGFSLTYLPFIARAVIDALADFPLVNASVGENALVVHNRINLAIVVQIAEADLPAHAGIVVDQIWHPVDGPVSAAHELEPIENRRCIALRRAGRTASPEAFAGHDVL